MACSLQGETVTFDGKVLRGSFDAATDKSALHFGPGLWSEAGHCAGVGREAVL